MKTVNCIPVLLSTFTLLSFTLLSSSSISADDSVVDNISISIPVACTMNGTNMNSHNATIVNGTYEEDIGTTTLKAFCNDAEGFAIYAAGYTGDEIGGTNSNKLVGTSASGNATIVTGLATSAGNPDVSNWAMKLATTSSPTPTYPIVIDSAPNIGDNVNASFSNYHTVPNEYTKVAHRDSATDIGTNAEGSTLTTTYRAYISKTQAADTYSGKVIYTLVHPASEEPVQPQTTQSSKICYYPNGSNVEGTMGCQTIPPSGTTGGVSPTSATLLASNFSRTGYGFAGWSTTHNYQTTGENAHFYGPQEYITYEEGQYTGDNDGLSLYAHWVKSAGSLQNYICPDNTTMPIGTVTALTDQRDDETYAVAKLADGNCWMIENLRLEAEDSDDGTLAQGFGKSTTFGNFSGLADSESTNFSDSSNANSIYYVGTQSDTAFIDIGTSGYPGYRMPRYNNLNTPTSTSNRPQDPTSNSFANNKTVVGMFSYGNYYTWPAALANTIQYSSTTATDADNKTSETVETSLCPAGWKLPRGGDKSREATNDFWALIVTGVNEGTNPANYSSSTAPYYRGTPEGSDVSNKLRAYPNNFLYSGYFDSSSPASRGSYGNYWTSTVVNSRFGYNLSLAKSNVYPGTTNSYKFEGYSIRCLLSNP